MRLLIVEDDRKLSQLMKLGLEKAGFTADVANTGAEGEEKAIVNSYDTILLDLNLPDKDGLEVLSFLQKNDVTTPVIIITARDEVQQRALGLNSGADDYVVKPFDFDELQARIRAVVRRFYGRNNPDIIKGRIKVCPHTRKAYLDGNELDLSVKEFDIIEYLANRSPEVVSSEDISEHVYDEYFDQFSSVLRVHISNLRKKLSELGGDRLLQTIKGKGYVSVHLHPKIPYTN